MRTARPRADDHRAGKLPATEVTEMHAAANELPLEMQHGDVETRGVEWGGQLVRHVALPPGTDFTPLFVGLPDDMCPCPHWGMVLGGAMRLRFADGTEEVVRAGETYYWPGGHTGWTDEGATFLEVSPADALRPVLEHLAARLTPSG